MPKSIDENARHRRRREALQSAVTFSAMRCLSAVVLLTVRIRFHTDGIPGVLLLAIALLELGLIAPVWILLKTRLKEIEGGEEDAAAQY